MRHLILFVTVIFLTAFPAAAVEFLGVELCEGSVDTSVVLPVGSPMTLESAEIGRHGGLLLLLTAESGDIMDHIDDLMVFYTDARGTGDSKKLQWNGNGLTAYAQQIKKGYAALAVSANEPCGEVDVDAEEETATAVPEAEERPAAPAAEASSVAVGAAAVAPPAVEHGDQPIPPPAPVVATGDEGAKLEVVDEPEPVADFVLEGRLKHTAAEEGWVDVMAVVVNNSGADYTVASFDLSLYDGAGELICVDTISVNQLRAGQERAFRSAIRCADYGSATVASWKLQFAGAH